MASTLLRGIVGRLVAANVAKKVLPPKTFFPQMMTVRGSGQLIPPSQYDDKWPKRMALRTVLVDNWEVCPLFGVTGVAIGIMFFSIIWAMIHKVDVVFTTHSRQNLSRTMNMLNPAAHKIILIDQTYKPWPKMYEVQVKMRKQQHRLEEQNQTASSE